MSCTKEGNNSEDQYYSVKVAFRYQAPKLVAPVEVQFINESKNAETFHWDFGDGQTSTEKDPRHVYNSGGLYKVTLTVNAAGRQLQASDYLDIKAAYTRCTMKGIIIDQLPLLQPDGKPWDEGSHPDLVVQVKYKGVASLLYSAGVFYDVNPESLPFQPVIPSFNFPSLTREYEVLIADDDFPSVPHIMGGYFFDMLQATSVSKHYPDTMLLYQDGFPVRFRLLLEWGY